MDTTLPTPPVPLNTSVNIDQMLWWLVQKTDTAVASASLSTPIAIPSDWPETPAQEPIAPTEVIQQSSPMVFNIDAIAKPTPVTLPTPLSDHTPEQRQRMILLAKKLWAVMATFFVVIGIGWIVSVQYPVEVWSATATIVSLFSTASSTVSKNLEDQSVVVSNSLTGEDVAAHSSADIYDDTTTPLADSLAEAQQQDTSSSSDQLRDSAIGTTTTEVITPPTEPTSWNKIENTWFPSETDLQASWQTTSVKDDLTALKQKVDAYLNQWSSPNKEAIARVIGRNIDTLLSQVEVATPDMISQISQDTAKLKDLVQKL